MRISIGPRRGERAREGKDQTLVHWAIVATVFVIILGALTFVFKQAGPLEGGVMARGRITAVNDIQGDGACSVTAAFEVNGQSYIASTSYASSGLCGFEVGSIVSVSYLPNDPTDNRVVTSRDDRTPWFFLGLFGLLALLATAGAVHQVLRRRKQAAVSPGDAGSSMASAPESRPGMPGTMSKDRAGVVDGVDLRQGASLPRPAAPRGAPLAVAPPGWYRDPDGQGDRWWDGRAWTVHQWAGHTEVQDAGDRDRR